MKYLGFLLKPNRYSPKDQSQIIKKVEKQISNWSYRYLPLGGRLTFIHYVLVALPVYWFSLALVPQFVLNDLRQKFFNFVWSSTIWGTKIHPVKWIILSHPKAMGGQDTKNLSWFNQVLCMKSCWRSLFGKGLWH